MKQLAWLGSSLQDVKAFPSKAKADIGYQLYKVQMGLEPSDWKPMSSVGRGVREIRVHTGIEYRVLYIAKFKEVIYILHAFDKKTRKTTKEDIELGRKRLVEIL